MSLIRAEICGPNQHEIHLVDKEQPPGGVEWHCTSVEGGGQLGMRQIAFPTIGAHRIGSGGTTSLWAWRFRPSGGLIQMGFPLCPEPLE